MSISVKEIIKIGERWQKKSRRIRETAKAYYDLAKQNKENTKLQQLNSYFKYMPKSVTHTYKK